MTRRLLTWPDCQEKFGGMSEKALRALFFEHRVPRIKVRTRVLYDEADLDELIDRLKSA